MQEDEHSVKGRSVDMSFIDTAPLKISHQVDLEASPQRVFEILADVDTWPRWFKGMNKAEWTSPEPHGVGSTRCVYLMGKVLRVDETFLAWDPGKHFAFRFDDQSLPLAGAAIEDLRLEDIGNGRCRLRYDVYLELPGPLKLMRPVVQPLLRTIFGRGVRGLMDYVKH